jgi:hypothetical protein
MDERRKHPRASAPTLTLSIDGVSYTALDWSHGGCRVNAPSGPFKIKQRVEGRINLKGAGKGEFVCEVVRLANNGDVGLRWLEISSQIFVLLGAPRDGK